MMNCELNWCTQWIGIWQMRGGVSFACIGYFIVKEVRWNRTRIVVPWVQWPYCIHGTWWETIQRYSGDEVVCGLMPSESGKKWQTSVFFVCLVSLLSQLSSSTTSMRIVISTPPDALCYITWSNSCIPINSIHYSSDVGFAQWFYPTQVDSYGPCQYPGAS